MTEFKRFQEVAESCEGYLIERLSFSRVDESDSLDIGLRWGPNKPDVTLSFLNVYYFVMGHQPGAGAEPLSEVKTTVLGPSDEPWPEGLAFEDMRSAALPPLIWLSASGPVQLDVLAAIATAYVEAR